MRNSLKDYEQSPWCFKPEFFTKLLWMIFSVIFLGVFIYIQTLYLDGYFTPLVAKYPQILALFMTFVFLSLVAATFFAHFNPHRKFYLYGVYACTSVFVIICIVFIATCGTQAKVSEWEKKIFEWIKEKPAANDRIKRSFYQKMGGDKVNVEEREYNVHEYISTHSDDLASYVIGGALVWGLFHVLFIYLLVKGDAEYTEKKKAEDSALAATLISA